MSGLVDTITKPIHFSEIRRFNCPIRIVEQSMLWGFPQTTTAHLVQDRRTGAPLEVVLEFLLPSCPQDTPRVINSRNRTIVRAFLTKWGLIHKVGC